MIRKENGRKSGTVKTRNYRESAVETWEEHTTERESRVDGRRMGGETGKRERGQVNNSGSAGTQGGHTGRAWEGVGRKKIEIQGEQ